jgi:hypothetical protein
MDDAGRLLERLRRIEALRLIEERSVDGGGRSAELLEELRALVPEAEAWARVEGDRRAVAAVSKLREEAGGMR